MTVEFENDRMTNFAVLLTDTKFCWHNLEIRPHCIDGRLKRHLLCRFQILPASCKRGLNSTTWRSNFFCFVAISKKTIILRHLTEEGGYIWAFFNIMQNVAYRNKLVFTISRFSCHCSRGFVNSLLLCSSTVVKTS